jgi:hypothetical protein
LKEIKIPDVFAHSFRVVLEMCVSFGKVFRDRPLHMCRVRIIRVINDRSRHSAENTLDQAKEFVVAFTGIRAEFSLIRCEHQMEEVLQWAPEFPTETEGRAVGVWLGERDSGGKRLKRNSSRKRPVFPHAFVEQFIPQWSDMMARIRRAKH